MNVLSNYRPVSSIPLISKLIEKVVVRRLTFHLNSNGLEDQLQSAFKAEHSTEINLLKVQHDIASALVVMLVMLDVSAAFDSVDHEQLMSLFEHEYGITGSALSWFRSYLVGRTYRVQIDESSSRCVSRSYIGTQQHCSEVSCEKSWSDNGSTFVCGVCQL